MRPAALLPLLALAILSASPLVAQAAPPPAAGVTVHGVVTDSLAGRPLADATVQLVVANVRPVSARTTTSDAAGRFAFADVPPGSYLLGFLHAGLDSLGLEPIFRAVTVTAGRDVRADLAIPGPERLRAAFCPGAAPGAAVTGSVRAAEGGAPVEGATVTAEWLEIAIGTGGMTRQVARRTATTGAGGEYALCEVPSPGTIMLRVSHGPHDTDRVEAEVPARGLLRRHFHLGESRVAARPDTAAAPDSLAPVRTGPGRLSGTVTAAVGGQPVAGAEVRVVNGAVARTDARGVWTLTDAPSGTRVLEVRAPGHDPVHRVVDVADGAPPVHLRLTRAGVTLDTLRVVALARVSPELAAFHERRRSSGAGRFLDEREIARGAPWEVSDLFDRIPGLERNRETDTLLMSNVFGEGGCTPAVFLDGRIRRNLSASDLDVLVRPADLAGMEVYRELQAPPQFQDALSGCGSIVLWTRRAGVPRRP